MSVSEANAKLETLAYLNGGPDTDCTFEILLLDQSESIELALDAYFSKIINWRTQQPHPASDWHISVQKFQNDPISSLREILKYWIFQLPYSPAPPSEREWVASNVINDVLNTLEADFKGGVLYEVITTPPVWYEGHWQDFVVSNEGRNWFLHFGVTD